MDPLAEGDNLREIGGRCVMDFGDIDKEGLTTGCLDGHIDSEAFAVARARTGGAGG